MPYLQEEQSDIKRFQKRFEAHITESREYRQSIRPPIDYMTLRNTATFEMEHRVEPCVAIHLPQHQFDRLMDDQTRMDSWRSEAEYAKKILSGLHRDEQIRRSNPTVEKAYQKYQMLLDLCR
jgi:hypothetical protein